MITRPGGAESAAASDSAARHANYVNTTVRINGRDEKFESDWIKHLEIKVE